jgi:cob(I)alamin adenosyltransferase
VKIYTKTGDRGETGLLGPLRVPKSHPRIEAYGSVDELNATIGLTRTEMGAEPGADALLARVQDDLFAIGAILATQPGVRVPSARAVTARDARRLERAIDAMTAELPPLRTFVLPGGSRGGAFLHLARTVCRRAERAVVALARQERGVPGGVIVYLNRLSDLLFVMARHANARAGVPDVPWLPRSKRLPGR